MMVFTTKGLIEMDRLTIRDQIELGDNHRKVISQYFLDDELVRQSVHIDLLRPVETQAAHGNLG